MIYVVTGNISSGKTTLAKKIALATKAPLLSSDTLRLKVQAQPQGAATGDEFLLMRQLAYTAALHKLDIVLDSTGMSYRFRNLVTDLRRSFPNQIFHIRLHCDRDTWYYREMSRDDRGPISEKFYEESDNVAWDVYPDMTINSNKDVFPFVIQELAARKYRFFRNTAIVEPNYYPPRK